MPATYQEARDQIFGAFWTAWQTLDPVPLVFWEEVGLPDHPPASAAWAAAFINHRGSEQAALADFTIGRRFRNSGIVTIQIFSPLDDPDTSQTYAAVVRDAFQGNSTEGGVWFRNARIEEVGIDGPWFHVNVLAEFEYDLPKA